MSERDLLILWIIFAHLCNHIYEDGTANGNERYVGQENFLIWNEFFFYFTPIFANYFRKKFFDTTFIFLKEEDEEFLPQNFFASQPHQSDDNCVGRSSSAASGNSKRKFVFLKYFQSLICLSLQVFIQFLILIGIRNFDYYFVFSLFHFRNSGNFTRSDEGFIHPEWSLIFMLGTGLLGIQMLPENTQSGEYNT